MTVRKKLVISNVLMIVIPGILVFFFVIIAFTSYGEDLYWDSIEDEIYGDDNGIYAIQSIIYSYKQEWLQESDEVDHLKNDTEYIKEMEQDFLYMGYHFYLCRAGEKVFGNLTQAEEKRMGEYLEDFRDDIENLTISAGECFIVKDIFEINGEDYEIIAMHMEGQNEKQLHESQTFNYQKYIMPIIFFFIVFIMIVVTLTNAILTKWIYQIILKPLNMLKNGTKEIVGGNLDYEFSYKNKDEFGEVCREFEQMREHLKSSVETRLQYEQYRKELIAGISHDLRTPLTSIKGYVEGLKDGITNTEEKRKRYYDAIHIRALDMETLLDSLSDFARLENGQHKYWMKSVNMEEYLKQLIKEYQEEAKQKKVILLFDNFARKTEVLLDVQQMHRVFMNLFENSIKYRTKEQSKIYIKLENKGAMLETCVADDGPGVADEKLPYIFNSFYRADDSRANPGDGSGLGLAIVKQIVEGHHGSIRAYNNNGLVIQMMLPLAKEK